MKKQKTIEELTKTESELKKIEIFGCLTTECKNNNYENLGSLDETSKYSQIVKLIGDENHVTYDYDVMLGILKEENRKVILFGNWNDGVI